MLAAHQSDPGGLPAYDMVVVGGGPHGVEYARRFKRALPASNVLLVESGDRGAPSRVAARQAGDAAGPWEYPPAAKFDRLLRHCEVPIGLLSNGLELRLFYAPSGQSSGSITFPLGPMLETGGRPILEALVMLLSRYRWFGAEASQQLPALLAASRARQADVTEELAGQVFAALQILLEGFQNTAERDGSDEVDLALARGDESLYEGLLTALLRMVFVLYAEDRALLPVEEPLYAENFSLFGLFDGLQEDQALFPDTMHLRLGGWARFIALCRTIYLGTQHGSFSMPARRGELFDPHRFPFLEGWGPEGRAPIREARERGAVRLPSVDDGTLLGVLEHARARRAAPVLSRACFRSSLAPKTAHSGDRTALMAPTWHPSGAAVGADVRRGRFKSWPAIPICRRRSATCTSLRRRFARRSGCWICVGVAPMWHQRKPPQETATTLE